MMNIFIVKRTPGHTECPGLALAQEVVGCGLWESTLSGRMMSTSRVAPEKESWTSCIGLLIFVHSHPTVLPETEADRIEVNCP